jgi:hypothetical protein
LQSTGNLLKNPGFDQWTSGWPTSWDKYSGTSSEERQGDANDCPESGATYAWSGGPTQCVGVSSRQAYTVGGYFAGGAPGTHLYIYWYTSTDCSGTDMFPTDNPLPFGHSGFAKASYAVESPQGARSARIAVESTAQISDQLFFGIGITDF